MSVEDILRQQIMYHLVENPIENRGTKGCYDEVAKKFGVAPDKVRRYYIQLRDKGLVEKDTEQSPTRSNTEAGFSHFKEDTNKGEADITQVTHRRIKTLEDLIEVCNIDTKIWHVASYEVNKWEVGRKDKSVEWSAIHGQGTGKVKDSGKIFVEPLFQVKAKLVRRKVDTDLTLQKELILAEIKKHKPTHTIFDTLKKYSGLVESFNTSKKDCALEINIPDLHIGKLAWGEESGDDYDIKIAVKRYKDAVAELLGRTNLATLEKIILVVGHDMLNVDGKNNLTTAGTPQSSDSRFYKMVKIAKQLLIETVDELSVIAPVDVMVVPGNHDSNSMLLLGDILSAWYHDSERVIVLNDAAPRKYYQYGQNGLMYAHGHNEKLQDLGIIFATENPKLWAATKFHRVHVGHWHHSKSIKFTDVQEYPGFVVKIINSLSSNDAWHAEKGYLSLKGAEAFLYHKDKGLLANYYYQL